jgi:hypothetical protein
MSAINIQHRWALSPISVISDIGLSHQIGTSDIGLAESDIISDIGINFYPISDIRHLDTYRQTL